MVALSGDDPVLDESVRILADYVGLMAADHGELAARRAQAPGIVAAARPRPAPSPAAD